MAELPARAASLLVQIDFVTELFEKAKEKGIHTCLDSSGITFTPDSTEKFERLLQMY